MSSVEKSPVNQRFLQFEQKKDIVDFMKKAACISMELMPESEYKELHRAEIIDEIFINL